MATVPAQATHRLLTHRNRPSASHGFGRHVAGIGATLPCRRPGSEKLRTTRSRRLRGWLEQSMWTVRRHRRSNTAHESAVHHGRARCLRAQCRVAGGTPVPPSAARRRPPQRALPASRRRMARPARRPEWPPEESRATAALSPSQRARGRSARPRKPSPRRSGTRGELRASSAQNLQAASQNLQARLFYRKKTLTND